METKINWISVHESLPESDVKVLVLTPKQNVFATSFDPGIGWKPVNLLHDRKLKVSEVAFWSYYNLPK